jgi:hypothetical protein
LSAGPWPGSNKWDFIALMKMMKTRMKTFLSVIDSYDEIIDFIFPPNLSFFMMKFELVPGRCFLHS